MKLFNKLPAPDSQQTMLAYRVRYWPYSELSNSPAARSRIVSNRAEYVPKSKLLEFCNDDNTAIITSHKLADGCSIAVAWPIAWAWNNVPTELEWDKKSDSFLIRTEFRVSPLIPEGRVVILSFELPSSKQL